jgi:hypothetical protein
MTALAKYKRMHLNLTASRYNQISKEAESSGLTPSVWLQMLIKQHFDKIAEDDEGRLFRGETDEDGNEVPIA